MSNGTHPRHVPRDSGTQPAVHYCTQRLTDDGTVQGCPDWPVCLFQRSELVTVSHTVAETERLAHLARHDWDRPIPHPPARALGGALLWSAVVVLVVVGGMLWAVLA